MKGLEDIKWMLCDELEDISKKGNLSAGDLDTVHKLTDTVKNIYKIEMYEGEDYPQDGGWRAEGNYSKARYGRGNSYRRYSRDDGRDMMYSEMDRMMSSGNMSASDKATIKRAMEILEK